MRTYRLGGQAALAAASLSGAALDSLFSAASGQPAIVPAPLWSGAAWLPQSDPHWSYSGTWSTGVTGTPGSAATLTYTGVGCVLWLQVTDASGAANRGIAWITVYGAPYLALDSYYPSTLLAPWLDGDTAELAILTPTGGTHTVTVTYYGDLAAPIANSGIGPVTNTAGTSVGPLLAPTRTNRGATTSQNWPVQAIDATHVRIYGSGSYALGTTVTGVIPGVSLFLLSGSMTVLSPPAAPTVTPTTGTGTVATGTYQVAVSYTTAGGETTPSTTTSAALLATGELTITSPPASGAATGWYAYVSQAGGSTLTRQQVPSSPTAIGTNYVVSAPPSSTGAAPLTTSTAGDTATVSTVPTGLTIQGAYVATQQVASSSLTTPLVASDGTLPLAGGQPLPLREPGADRAPLQWLLAAWEEDPNHPVTAGSAATGNTLNPADASWASTPAAPGYSPAALAISHDGLGHGHMGMAVLPRGAYCQVTVQPPAGGYVRNLRLYGWDPDHDPDRLRFPPVPGDDLAVRLYGGLAAGWAIVERDPMRELLASMSLGTAVGALLDQHGAEWSLPRPFGADDGPYATLLRFLSAARTQGGTVAFYRQALTLLLGPASPFSIQSLAGTTTDWTLGSSRLGIDTALGHYTPGAWQAQLAVTVHTLALPPQTVQTLAELFRPVGVTLIYSWQ